ncbi:MAG: helix-turn-helix domain-containing protein [Alphaproteobacteria bacterium]
MIETLRFTISEMLSLIGLVQCTYILVHLAIRGIYKNNAVLPFVYFLCLAIAFFLDFATRYISHTTPIYEQLLWLAWFIGTPLSVVFIIRLSNATKKSLYKKLIILLTLPVCWLFSMLAVNMGGFCRETLITCAEFNKFLYLSGLVASTVSLLFLFSQGTVFQKLKQQKNGIEKYWLSMSLIVINVAFLIVVFAYLSNNIEYYQMVMLRTILGLGFVYIVSTSLLRLYTNKSKVKKTQGVQKDFNDQEKKIFNKVNNLIFTQKVYQEINYSRKELAQECNTSEALISKVVNQSYNKTVPALLNECRIIDAKQLLRETDAPIKRIAEDVGFNSMPTFNRVFKEFSGLSPSDYRKGNSPDDAKIG